VAATNFLLFPISLEDRKLFVLFWVMFSHNSVAKSPHTGFVRCGAVE
jgi:hypothetical protein